MRDKDTVTIGAVILHKCCSSKERNIAEDRRELNRFGLLDKRDARFVCADLNDRLWPGLLHGRKPRVNLSGIPLEGALAHNGQIVFAQCFEDASFSARAVCVILDKQPNGFEPQIARQVLDESLGFVEVAGADVEEIQLHGISQ